jgi:hypothetical protein
VRPRTASLAALALVMLCGVYASRFVTRGWIPHDEGTIGQTAERVLAGQMPHRDFDDVYTGGLACLNAAAMAAFGVDLLSPRLLLFAVFLAFVAAVYGVARAVAGPMASLAASALAAVWSVPNYFAALPSWYNLFFAVFGTLAMARFVASRRAAWLVAAGFCGGLSVLMKISGVYYLAGAALFLIDFTQNEGGAAASPEGSRPWRRVSMAAAPAVAAIAAAVWLVGSGRIGQSAIAIVLPAVLATIVVAWRGWTPRAAGANRTGVGAIWLFAAGVAIPVAIFTAFYAIEGGLAELVRGVFVLPQRRLSAAAIQPPALVSLALAAPFACLCLIRRPVGGRVAAIVSGAVLAVSAVVLVASTKPTIYRAVWAAARAMPLVAVVAGIRAVHAPWPAESAARRATVFLLVAMAATMPLIQFPYATPIYFCYAAPMVVLALTAVAGAQHATVRRLYIVPAAFFLAFGLWFVNGSYGWNLGVAFVPYDPPDRMTLARAPLRVPSDDRRTYEHLVEVLRERAAGGTIYAGPDCPEVYFLSGFPNPSRTIFDFLSPDPIDRAWMAHLLDTAPIRAAVIDTAPLFSRPIDEGARAEIERRFPHVEQIGRFVVRY